MTDLGFLTWLFGATVVIVVGALAELIASGRVVPFPAGTGGRRWK
jgi:hypothetical protein